MKKITIYPKTKRIGNEERKVYITEKLDGSNLGFFNIDGKLHVAQRNNMFVWDSVKEEGSQGLYKGLYGWLTDNADELLNSLCEGSGVFGEWISMGQIKYKDSLDGVKFHVFAKARLNEEFVVSNMYYDPTVIKYAFINQKMPLSISQVKTVYETLEYPSVSDLDVLYDEYVSSIDRKVEGFIVVKDNAIKKYVRYKNGKPSAHKS